MEKYLLTVKEAAKLVGIGRNSAYNLVHSGDWDVVKTGRKLLVPRAFLEKKYVGEFKANTEEATSND